MFEAIREFEIEKLKAEKEIEVKALKHQMEVTNISMSEEIFTLNTWEFQLLIIFIRCICVFLSYLTLALSQGSKCEN
jgi:hypothetical protein